MGRNEDSNGAVCVPESENGEVMSIVDSLHVHSVCLTGCTGVVGCPCRQ